MSLITLTTDFDTRDWFVAAMKGVIAGIAPDARVVDVTHEIGGQDILAGSFVLAQCFRNFPRGTIHVAVVDPGVGSPRRAIAVKTADYIFLAPDNGVLTLPVAVVSGVCRTLPHGGRIGFQPVQKLRSSSGQAESLSYGPRPSPTGSSDRRIEIREITNERLFNRPVSRTFHGRDIFAPVAAHLATGIAFEEVGPVVEEMVRLETSEPKITKKGIEGRVMFVDRFGNLITNIAARHLEQLPSELKSFRIGRHTIRKFGRFYAEAAPGKAIALIGSSNYVELCVNGGSAQRKFGAKVGDVIRVS